MANKNYTWNDIPKLLSVKHQEDYEGVTHYHGSYDGSNHILNTLINLTLNGNDVSQMGEIENLAGPGTFIHPNEPYQFTTYLPDHSEFGYCLVMKIHLENQTEYLIPVKDLKKIKYPECREFSDLPKRSNQLQDKIAYNEEDIPAMLEVSYPEDCWSTPVFFTFDKKPHLGQFFDTHLQTEAEIIKSGQFNLGEDVLKSFELQRHVSKLHGVFTFLLISDEPKSGYMCYLSKEKFKEIKYGL